MALLARLRSFWRHALHRSDLERNMSDEWQFHLARRAEDLVESRGLSPEEAMRIARLEFGSVEKYKEEGQERLLATLAAFFGALALLLAMIGLYGVLTYLVTHRQTEFGIRMALGADRASILRLVMTDVVIVLAGGLASGLAVSLVSVTLLQRMLFGLEPRDPMTMVSAVCLLSAMALLAGYLPARRATRVDPMVALRSE
jgi:predicted lysophospholipase L1 biosynthesis ABC-type transport system permease subunit